MTPAQPHAKPFRSTNEKQYHAFTVATWELAWVIEFTQLKFKTLKSNVHEALRNRGGRF